MILPDWPDLAEWLKCNCGGSATNRSILSNFYSFNLIKLIACCNILRLPSTTCYPQEASFITGQTLAVDGGRSVALPYR